MIAYCNGDRKLEKKIHREFKNKRVNGEWFKVTKKTIKECVQSHGGAFLCEESKESKLQDRISSLEEEIVTLNAESQSLKDRLIKYHETKLDIEEERQELADRYASFFESGDIAKIGSLAALTFFYMISAYDPKENFFHMPQKELVGKLGCSRSSLRRTFDILMEERFIVRKKVSHKIVGYSINKHKG